MTIAEVRAESMEAPVPCMSRDPMSKPMFSEIPHRKDPMINTRYPAEKIARYPIISPSRPKAGRKLHMIRRYAMITQETSAELTPKSWDIVGRLILTMVTSRVLIKTARPTVMSRSREEVPWGLEFSATVIFTSQMFDLDGFNSIFTEEGITVFLYTPSDHRNDSGISPHFYFLHRSFFTIKTACV